MSSIFFKAGFLCTFFFFSEIIRCENFETKYVVDEMAKNEGHDVLRLPPYHCIFNPIELVWAELKHRLREKNVDPKNDVKVVERLRESVAEITPENWKKYVKHVIKIEEKFREHDQEAENDKLNFAIEAPLDDDEENDELNLALQTPFDDEDYPDELTISSNFRV